MPVSSSVKELFLFLFKRPFKPNNGPGREHIKDIVVQIYSKKLETRTMEQVKAVTLEQAVGNAGGLFGLWLGASMLIFVEIVEFVTNSFYCFLFWAKKRILKVSCASNAPHNEE